MLINIYGDEHVIKISHEVLEKMENDFNTIVRKWNSNINNVRSTALVNLYCNLFKLGIKKDLKQINNLKILISRSYDSYIHRFDDLSTDFDRNYILLSLHKILNIIFIINSSDMNEHFEHELKKLNFVKEKLENLVYEKTK